MYSHLHTPTTPLGATLRAALFKLEKRRLKREENGTLSMRTWDGVILKVNDGDGFGDPVLNLSQNGRVWRLTPEPRPDLRDPLDHNYRGVWRRGVLVGSFNQTLVADTVDEALDKL